MLKKDRRTLYKTSTNAQHDNYVSEVAQRPCFISQGLQF